MFVMLEATALQIYIFSPHFSDGEDDFESIYGCTMQWDQANDHNSRLPPTDDDRYTADTVALAKLLDPTDEDAPSNGCLHDDDYVGEMPGGDTLGGEDVSGDWCTCEKDACNGGEVARGAYSAALVSLAVAFMCA